MPTRIVFAPPKVGQCGHHLAMVHWYRPPSPGPPLPRRASFGLRSPQVHLLTMVVVDCGGFEGPSLDGECVLVRSVGPLLHGARRDCRLCSICLGVPRSPVLGISAVCRVPPLYAIRPILV